MSGIDWLGEVNPSWGYAPLFTLGNPKKTPNRGMIEQNLLSLSYGRVVRRDIESSEGLVPASYETYQIVEPGDTVLRFTDLQNDQRSLRSGLVRERGIITSAYLSFTPDEGKLYPAFFAYLMRAVDLSKVFYRMGSGVRQSLNWGEFSLIRLPLPPLETQQRIADYLDRETAEIDAAVADLDKYVELLKKREEILVEELLCKSRFPKVPLFTFCHLSSGDGIDKGNLEHSGRFPVYGGNGVMGYSDRSNRNQDTLVVGRVGALCGNVHYAKAPFFVTDNALVLSLKSDVSLDWLQFALRNLRLRDLSQSSAQPVITATTVLRQRVSLPPAPRQLQIASRIGEETAEIKALIAESTKLRDLLLQRRSVLITEVVTGRKQV